VVWPRLRSNLVNMDPVTRPPSGRIKPGNGD
jgi:hypothetical protein